jgi:hypothetical protein
MARLPFLQLFGGFRLLRGVVRQLTRIADALEYQNLVLEAAHPEAAARLRSPELVVVDPADTGPSYVDPAFAERAEEVRHDVYLHTGRRLDDEELLTYMAETEQEGRWRFN